MNKIHHPKIYDTNSPAGIPCTYAVYSCSTVSAPSIDPLNSIGTFNCEIWLWCRCPLSRCSLDWKYISGDDEFPCNWYSRSWREYMNGSIPELLWIFMASEVNEVCICNDSDEDYCEKSLRKGWCTDDSGWVLGLPIAIPPCTWYFCTTFLKAFVRSDHRKTLISFSIFRTLGVIYAISWLKNRFVLS